mgnify:FL=1
MYLSFNLHSNESRLNRFIEKYCAKRVLNFTTYRGKVCFFVFTKFVTMNQARKWRMFWMVALVSFAGLQLIPIERSNPPLNTGEDLLYSRMVPEEMQQLVKMACYDCHSNETVYPWYSWIAPVSFVLRHHIKEGREHLNFSIWNTYMDKRKDHTLDDCIEVVEEGEMPLKPYRWMHPEARLTPEQRDQLADFFREQVRALGWREMGSEEEEEMENGER